MTYYAKLFNNIGSISATYKDANDADQTVVIAGGGVVTAVPFQVFALPGVIRAHDAGNLKIYSDVGATTEIATFPNSTVSAGDLPLATTTVAGAVKKAAAHADSSAAANVAALETAYNGLLAKLRTAGILAP